MPDTSRTIRQQRRAQEPSPSREQWLLRQALRRMHKGATIRGLLNEVCPDRSLVDRIVRMAALDLSEGFCPLHHLPLERGAEWAACPRCGEMHGKKAIGYRMGQTGVGHAE